MGRDQRDRTLLLCGMMGAGKSAVGRALAERLRRPFVDTDELVERAEGLAVREIFERHGEPYFRAREREVLVALPERAAVVALGGGAVTSPENRALLRSKGILVLLEAAPETLAARVGASDQRPLLAGARSPEERSARLGALQRERSEAYASADLSLATDGRDVEQVCDALLERLGWEAAA